MTGAAADSLTQSVACAINRAAGGRPIPGNRVELLIDGPDAYAAMLALIARASRWIHFENYIIRDDDVGRRFARALAERDASDIVVFGGGIIPDEDIPVLEEIGVAKVFTPGAPTTEITGWVAQHFGEGAGTAATPGV